MASAQPPQKLARASAPRVRQQRNLRASSTATETENPDALSLHKKAACRTKAAANGTRTAAAKVDARISAAGPPFT